MGNSGSGSGGEILLKGGDAQDGVGGSVSLTAGGGGVGGNATVAAGAGSVGAGGHLFLLSGESAALGCKGGGVFVQSAESSGGSGSIFVSTGRIPVF